MVPHPQVELFFFIFGWIAGIKKTFEIKWPLVRGKYNQIAAFWNPIVCMIYMAAVLIQLLTLKHLLHFLQAIINYAEKLCFFFKYLSKFQKTTKMLENPKMNVG